MSDNGRIKYRRLFQFLIRVKCPAPIYYWLLDRLTDNNGWRPLSMRQPEYFTKRPHRIEVTREQVQAARIHVQAYRSAGLTPDPMVVKLANAEGYEK